MKNVLIFLSLVCITLEQGFNQGFPYRQNINNPFGQNQRNQIPQQYSYEQNQRNQIPQQYSYGQNPQNLNNAQNQKNQNQRNQIPRQYSYEQNQRNQIPQQYTYGQNPQNLNNAQNQKNQNQYIQQNYNNIQSGNRQNNAYNPNNNIVQNPQNQNQFNNHQFLKSQQQFYSHNQQNINYQQNQNFSLNKNNKNQSNLEEIYIPYNIHFPRNFKSIYEQKIQNLSLHYENCDNINISCINGLTCKLNRCLTNLELNKTKDLGLRDKNLCNDSYDCPVEQDCIFHRCVDDEEDVDINKRNEDYDPSINLLFAGAIFLNGRAYKSGLNPDNSFNYDHFFKYIKNDINKADLAIIDQETIFELKKSNFSKKLSNTPPELGDAIANAGFKVILHGSLYAFSKEEIGIINTIKFWKNKYPNIKILGISEDEKSSNGDYYIFSKNDIKIGLVNFYGHGKKMIPKDKQFYINMVTKEKVKEVIRKLSTETDFVIVCVNWGTKNSKEPTKKQMKWAKEFAANGAKLIIGHHSSFVQQVSSVKSKGKRALVFWSLGHLINDNKRKYSILGAMANITISKSDDGAYISEYNLIPTINHKDKGKHYSIYKLSQYSNELFKISNVNHTKFSRKDIVKKCNFLMGGLADCF